MNCKKRGLAWVTIIMITVQLFFPQAAMAETVKEEKSTGTVYYVDSEQGDDLASGTSEHEAWESLDKINSTTFEPGDKLLLKAGGSWFGQLHPKGSGEEGAPIILDRYGDGDKPLIDGQGLVKSAVRLRNQEYWEINNLEVTNWNDEIGYYAGIRVTAYEESRAYRHIVIRDCYIHDIHGVREMGPTDTTGVSEPRKRWYEDGYSSDWFKGAGGISIVAEDQRGTYTTTHSSGGKNYTVTHETELSGYEGKTWFDDILLEGNVIENVSQTGIRIAQSSNLPAYSNSNPVTCIPFTNVVIRGNLINGGLEWSDFAMLITPTKDPLVEYNIAHDWRTSGLECTNTTDGIFQYNEVYNINHWATTKTADECTFDADMNSSNVIFQYNYAHDAGSAFLACSISNKSPIIFRYNIAQNISDKIMYGPKPGTFYNNTFYSPGKTNSISVDGNMPVYNNIIWAKELKVSSGITIDNNLYWGGCKAPSADKNAVTADPLFVDPGKGETGTEPGKPRIDSLNGYQIQAASPAIDRGRLIENPGERDYFGNPLYLDYADIGAHEYSGEDKPKDVVELVSLNRSRMYLEVGANGTLEASVFPEKVVNKRVTYLSSDPETVTVDAEGNLYAKQSGTAVITAASMVNPDITAECTVIAVEDARKKIVPVSEDGFVKYGIKSNENNNSGSLAGQLQSQVNSDPGWNKDIYLKFDLSHADRGPEQTYTLRLYANLMESAVDETIGLYETKADWEEETITGKTAPARGKKIAEYKVVNPTKGTVNSTGQWFEFDMTAYMEDWTADQEFLSIVLKNEGAPHNNCMISFNSKEAGSNSPQLILESPASVIPDNPQVKTGIGEIPFLPEKLECTDAAGQKSQLGVIWEMITPEMVAKSGIVEIKGSLENGVAAFAAVHVLPWLSFNLNYEGAAETRMLAEPGQKLVEIPKAERDGYVLKEWNTKPDGTGETLKTEVVYTSRENQTVYAIWRDQETLFEIKMESSRIYMKTGDSRVLRVLVQPDTVEHKKVDYASSDDSVVTVEADGTLHAMQEGTAVLTVTSQEDKKISNQCTIIVRERVFDESNSVSKPFAATDDAFVRDGGHASTSQHTGEMQKYLFVRCSDPGYARQSYVQFNLNDLKEKQADQVILRLHAFSAGSKTDTQELGVYQTDPGWGESDITYAKSPTSKEMVASVLVENLPVTDRGDETAIDQWIEIDLTDYVNQILSNPNADQKVSFKLMNLEQNGEPSYDKNLYSGNQIKFNSKEEPDQELHPQLIIKQSKYQLEEAIDITTEQGMTPVLPDTIHMLVATESDAVKMDATARSSESVSKASPSDAMASPSDAKASPSNAGFKESLGYKKTIMETREYPVTWEALEEEWYANVGSFQMLGQVETETGLIDVIAVIQVEAASEKPVLIGLEIVEKPKKLDYEVGDFLDLRGLMVGALYSDGGTNAISDYKTDPEEGTRLDHVGDHTILVSYEDNGKQAETEFVVSVKKKDITDPPEEPDVVGESDDREENRSAGGVWKQDASGWWYQREDGTYPNNEWIQIGTLWYHFDKQGYMQTGWILDSQKWYYLEESGSMKTGWLKLAEGWYYLHKDGKMATGRIYAAGTWYSMHETGVMITENAMIE